MADCDGVEIRREGRTRNVLDLECCCAACGPQRSQDNIPHELPTEGRACRH